MSRIAVVTDTNSSITAEEAEKLGIYMIPMPIIIDGEGYSDGVDCSYEQFFEKLENGADVSSSQPSPYSVTSVWDKVLKEYDEIIHIPMSSALSASYETAEGLARNYAGRVHVIDNKRISISQRRSVLDALCMIEKGMTADEIAAELVCMSGESRIYLAVNTLELLKKSGRVTAAGAAVASILGIKPVLQIKDSKLDAFAKVRGMALAQKTMLKAVDNDLKELDFRNVKLYLAYSGDIEPALKWKEMCEEHFGIDDIELCMLPLSICCHVAGGVTAIGCMSAYE